MGFLKKPCRDILDAIETEAFKEKENILNEEIVKDLTEKLNKTIMKMRSLLFVHDFENSTKFCFLLYMLSYLGKLNLEF